MKNLAKAVAHQTKPQKFKRFMEMMWDLSKEAIKWFNKTNWNGVSLLTKEP